MKTNTTVTATTAKRPSFLQREKNRLIFYVAIVGLPVLQFCIFYLGVNFNSILLAFQSFKDGAYKFSGLDNFRMIIFNFKTVPYMVASIKNSLTMYGVTLVCAFAAIIFAYYIYKGRLGHKFFRLVLFMPQIISSIILVVMFKFFTERAVPFIWEKLFDVEIQGLLSNVHAVFPTILLYNFWFSFGVSMLMYVGAMSGINPSVIEAGKLEGIKPFRELFSIVLPMIWPTVSTFLVVGVAGIFVHQMNLFSFFGDSAEYNLYTFGYLLYNQTRGAGLADYPYLAALGLMLTLVAVPLTFGVKYLLEKLGPKTY